MHSLSQLILRTDVSGMPLEWIDYREAVRLYSQEQVAYTCGDVVFELHGGINARTGRRSEVRVNAILATHGDTRALNQKLRAYTPPLNNAALFRRDCHVCLYCGERFSRERLSRDHVRPVSRGGADHWNNVVTACKRCNHLKGGRTPEQAGLELLAIPFVPSHAEYIFLQGKRILADQMEFLRAHFPRTSPIHERLTSWGL